MLLDYSNKDRPSRSFRITNGGLEKLMYVLICYLCIFIHSYA